MQFVKCELVAVQEGRKEKNYYYYYYYYKMNKG